MVSKEHKQAEANLFRIAKSYSIGKVIPNKKKLAIESIKADIPEWSASWLT